MEEFPKGVRHGMKVSDMTAKKLKALKNAVLDERGFEINNPNPTFLNVGPTRMSLQERIKRIVHHEISREAYDQGFETEEEADDFDVSDDFETEPLGKYDLVTEEEFIEPVEPAPADAGEPGKEEPKDAGPSEPGAVTDDPDSGGEGDSPAAE